MTTGEIIGLIIVILTFALFYIIIRCFLIYTMTKDMTEKESDKYLKDLEEAEANYLITHQRDL